MISAVRLHRNTDIAMDRLFGDVTEFFLSQSLTYVPQNISSRNSTAASSWIWRWWTLDRTVEVHFPYTTKMTPTLTSLLIIVLDYDGLHISRILNDDDLKFLHRQKLLRTQSKIGHPFLRFLRKEKLAKCANLFKLLLPGYCPFHISTDTVFPTQSYFFKHQSYIFLWPSNISKKLPGHRESNEQGTTLHRESYHIVTMKYRFYSTSFSSPFFVILWVLLHHASGFDGCTRSFDLPVVMAVLPYGRDIASDLMFQSFILHTQGNSKSPWIERRINWKMCFFVHIDGSRWWSARYTPWS